MAVPSTLQNDAIHLFCQGDNPLTLDSLIQIESRDLVEFREVGVDHYLLGPDNINTALNYLGRKPPGEISHAHLCHSH